MPDIGHAGVSPAAAETIAGLSAGTVATLVVHPLDIVKTRMQSKWTAQHPAAPETEEAEGEGVEEAPEIAAIANARFSHSISQLARLFSPAHQHRPPPIPHVQRAPDRLAVPRPYPEPCRQRLQLGHVFLPQVTSRDPAATLDRPREVLRGRLLRLQRPRGRGHDGAHEPDMGPQDAHAVLR